MPRNLENVRFQGPTQFTNPRPQNGKIVIGKSWGRIFDMFLNEGRIFAKNKFRLLKFKNCQLEIQKGLKEPATAFLFYEQSITIL